MRISLFAPGFALAVLLLAPAAAEAQWGNEQELRQRAESHRASSKCSDVWVSFAFELVTAGGHANPEICKVRNFNNGRWSSLNELISLMDCRLRRGVPCGDVELAQYIEPRRGITRVISTMNGLGVGYIDLNPTNTIVAAGGGNIVAAGAGNIVAAGGGNIVAAGGGNIVAAGGGNLISKGGAGVLPQATMDMINRLPPANGAGYRLMSTSPWVGLGTVTVARMRGKDDKIEDTDAKFLSLEVPVRPGDEKKDVPVKR